MTLRPPFPSAGACGASHVLRRRSACMPRPVDSGGPSHPRQRGCSWRAFGVREHPRRPQQAYLEAVPALQRLPRTRSGGARSPLRPPGCSVDASSLVFAVVSATPPPWTHDSRRAGGSPFPDRDFHPARDAKLFLARERSGISRARLVARRLHARVSQHLMALTDIQDGPEMLAMTQEDHSSHGRWSGSRFSAQRGLPQVRPEADHSVGE